MLLFTAFILGFVLSSVESTTPFEECKSKYKAFEDDFSDLPEEFDYDYYDLLEICKNPNQACTEKYYKTWLSTIDQQNDLKLNVEELVKACNCSSQNCEGNKDSAGIGSSASDNIRSAGFGVSVSGKQIMCGYLLSLMAVFGIVGNVMSMKVFWHPEMWKLKINQILFSKLACHYT